METNKNNETAVDFVVQYKELFNPAWRIIAFWGGRSSGKSLQVALSLLLRGRQKQLRILCTRQIQNTIKDSVHKLLKDLINKYEWIDYKVTDDSIINRITGTDFIFKGLLRNIQEIKSLEGVDVCWIEEGQTVTDESINILTPTIRKEGSQIIITFNRFTDLDPVYVRYVLNPPPHTYQRKVNYDILEKLGLLSQVIKDEIEYDKENNPDLYAYKWLGEPLSQGEFSAIKREDILKSMSQQVSDEGQEVVGVDVARMGDDRIVLWKRKGLKTLGYKVYEKLRINETVDRIKAFVSNKDTKILVDDTGVGGGVTDSLLAEQYNVIPINFGAEPADKDKYPNLISEAWFYLASIIKEIELPMDQDLLMELSTRRFKVDSRERRCIEGKADYKKRGYRSPDLADACIICYYNPQIIEPDIHFI